MRSLTSFVRVGSILLLLVASACVKRTPVGVEQTPAGPTGPSLVLGSLAAPGSPPFHLKAIITERGDPTSQTEVEIFWAAPDQWRRTIKSDTEFSQTLIVNHGKVFEQDSGDYFPLWSQTLAVAMVDPTAAVESYNPSDSFLTKTRDRFRRIWRKSFSKRHLRDREPDVLGLHESVGAARHQVSSLNYQYFHDVRVARILFYKIDPGDSYHARIIELTDFDPHADPVLFDIPRPTPKRKQIGSVAISEAELRDRARQPLEIIWPQVLDGRVTGETSYYVSTDRSGQVREALPLSVMAERADDSARRQIMKWKFTPLLQGGVPAQAQSVLTFSFNTRAYGPADPLTDEEARKLASNIVEPVFPPGTVSGATFTIRIAVDTNGDVIESIAGDGVHEIYPACAAALRQWRFRPIMENGQPRPYRAQIICRVP